MDYRKFFDKCTFSKIAEGSSNWDYYLMQYKEDMPTVAAIAKEGTGASDSQFGDLKYFERYLKSNRSNETKLTNFGETLFV